MHGFKNAIAAASAGWVLLAGTWMLTQPAVAQVQMGGQTGSQASPTDRIAVLEAVLSIGHAYPKWVGASNNKNTNALIQWLQQYCTSDFTLNKLEGASQTRPEWEAYLKQNIPHMKTAEKARMKVEKLSLKGNTAIAIVSYRFCDIFTDPEGTGQQKIQAGVLRDTWVKTPQGWKIKSREQAPNTKTMDDK